MKKLTVAFSLVGLSLGIANAFPPITPITSYLHVTDNVPAAFGGVSANVTDSSGGIVPPRDQYLQAGSNTLESQEGRDGSRGSYTVAFSTRGPAYANACFVTFTAGLGYSNEVVKGYGCHLAPDQATVVLDNV